MTTLVPAPVFPCFMCLWGRDKETEEELQHLLQHKARVISWKWTHTQVWYMGSPLACNSNLRVLYDFIQNALSLCGATKHITAEWQMAPVSASKAGGGYNMYSHSIVLEDESVLINYSEINLPHCTLFRSAGWALLQLRVCVSVCAYVRWFKCPAVACPCWTEQSWLKWLP